MQKITTAEIQELIRQEKREYARRWRSENKDKVKRNNEAYWQRRAEKRLQQEA